MLGCPLAPSAKQFDELGKSLVNRDYRLKVDVAQPSRWTGERIARLGFLVGLGWDANRMAEDPIILSTPNNVHRQVQRFGLAFRAAMPALLDGVGPDAAARFQTAAVKRGLSREGLIRVLLLEIATDPNLIDNILDDQEKAA